VGEGGGARPAGGGVRRLAERWPRESGDGGKDFVCSPVGLWLALGAVVAVRAGSTHRPRRVLRIAFDRPFGMVVLDGSGEVPLFTAWQPSAPLGALPLLGA
jgi:hypothetical protein